MKQWYLLNDLNKKRLLREIKYIEEFNKKHPGKNMERHFLGDSKHFCISYIEEYQNKLYRVVCIYPVTYPQTRIQVIVFEYNEDKREFETLKRGYHNLNGVLCLLLHYPNQWDDEYGIEFVVNRVKEWFKEGQYDKSNNIPHNYNIDNDLFILPEDLNFDEGSKYGIFEFYIIREKLNIITSVSINRNTVHASKIPDSLKPQESQRSRGIMIYTSKKIDEDIIDYSGMKSYLNVFKRGFKGFLKVAKENQIEELIPLILFDRNNSSNSKAFIIDLSDKQMHIKACRFFLLSVYKSIFARVKDRDSLNYLRRKKIGIVGLGAIGSVVATELARSGVGNFVLIDYDKLEVPNIGRHDLTLSDVDKYKVIAIKDKINDINPEANCITFNYNVLDDNSICLTELKKCDLIISTIDDQEAKYAIDSIMIPLNKKVIYSGAFYNSVAGYVFISDKKIACFNCISQIMDQMAAEKEIPDFSAMVPKDTVYNCGMPTFPGGSINTHTISLATSRIALNTLLGELEVDSNNQPYNLFLIGNEKIMIDKRVFFKGFMDIKRFILPGIQGCKICDNTFKLTEEENEKFMKELEMHKIENILK